MTATAFARGNQLLREGKLEEAIASYQEAIEKNPHFAYSYQNLGETLEKLGRIEEAIAAFGQAVAIDPRNPWFFYKLGIMLIQKGHFQQAVNYLHQAINLKNDVPKFYVGLGIALVKLGQWSDAVEYLDKSLKMLYNDFSQAEAFCYLGEAKSKQQKWSEAVECYRQSWEINPGRVECYIGWAAALGKLGQWEQAVELYREVVVLSGESVSSEVLFSLGQALAQLGKWKEAIVEYQKAISLGFVRADVRHHLGYALMQLGRWEEAVIQYRQVVEFNQKSAVVRHQLGYALMRLGYWREASLELRKSVELYPGSAVVWQQLSDVLWELEKRDEAEECEKQAIKIQPNLAGFYFRSKQNPAFLRLNEEPINLFNNNVESKGTIVFVSHDLEIGGAQKLLLLFINWVVTSTFYKAKIVAMRTGVNRNAFRKTAPTYIIQPSKSASQVSKDISEFLGKDVKLVFINSVASGEFLNYWQGNVPVVVFVHELEKIIQQKIEGFKILKSKANYFLGVSLAVIKSLVNKFGVDSQKCKLSYGFIEDRPFLGDSSKKTFIRKKFSIKTTSFVVMGCGVVHWRKCPDQFIEVALLIKNQLNADFKFIWIGGGSDLDLCRNAICEKGLDDVVEFIGYKPDAITILEAADVFLLTSEEDPFPLVCLEALSVEVPVICFEGAGGMPELVSQGCGTVVPFGNCQAMADAVLHYHRNPEIARAEGKKGRELVNSDLTIKTVGPKLFHVLSEVASLHPHL